MLQIITDLLDDRNVILYVLFILALVYPEQAEIVVGGVLGYWARDKVEK